MGNPRLNITEIGSYEDWFLLLATEPTTSRTAMASRRTASWKIWLCITRRLATVYSPVLWPGFWNADGRDDLAPHFRGDDDAAYQSIFDWVHDYTTGRSSLLLWLDHRMIPDLIDTGVDILNPVQTRAARMDPVALKQEFGDRSASGVGR